MLTIEVLLMLAAVILLVLATVGVNSGRFNLVAAGLACWALALLLPLI